MRVIVKRFIVTKWRFLSMKIKRWLLAAILTRVSKSKGRDKRIVEGGSAVVVSVTLP